MYGDNRDLHSFPTRRSSDLGIAPCGCPKSVSVEESGLVVDVAAIKVVLRGLEVNPGDPVVRVGAGPQGALHAGHLHAAGAISYGNLPQCSLRGWIASPNSIGTEGAEGRHTGAIRETSRQLPEAERSRGQATRRENLFLRNDLVVEPAEEEDLVFPPRPANGCAGKLVVKPGWL